MGAVSTHPSIPACGYVAVQGLPQGAQLACIMSPLSQVLVSFKDPATVPPHCQVATLSALASLVDSLEDLDLRGCRIVLGERHIRS
jgi:hypothetical protein